MIQYYNKERKDQIKQIKKYKKRNKGLSQQTMVDKLIKNFESKKKPEKVTIKKYFRNTFGDRLNDAMYELSRKQIKFPDNPEFFTVEGCCEFVGEYLLGHLPEHEEEALKEEMEKISGKKESER